MEVEVDPVRLRSGARARIAPARGREDPRSVGGVSFLDRYVAGEHAKVWSELCAMGTAVRDVLDDARAVASEMSRRVRHDIEILQARWEERGYVFGYDWAGSWASALVERAPPRLGRPADPAVLDDYEARVGPLPLSLRALAEVVGAVNFVGRAPIKGWPLDEELDALQLVELVPQLGESSVTLFPDHLHKIFVSGVGSVTTRVPCPNADAELWFEGGPVRVKGSGTPWLLVPYLREAILGRGGIGPFGMAKRRPALTKDLRLLPF